jgi:hypothetical protein
MQSNIFTYKNLKAGQVCLQIDHVSAQLEGTGVWQKNTQNVVITREPLFYTVGQACSLAAGCQEGLRENLEKPGQLTSFGLLMFKIVTSTKANPAKMKHF